MLLLCPALNKKGAHLGSVKNPPHHGRGHSWSQRLINALGDRGDSAISENKDTAAPAERVWYDQFTSTDWVHDSIADGYRVKALRSRKGFWGRVYILWDSAQGWVLSAVVGLIVAAIAYVVDVSESTVFDFKDGYCATGWYLSEKACRVIPSTLILSLIHI